MSVQHPVACAIEVTINTVTQQFLCIILYWKIFLLRHASVQFRTIFRQFTHDFTKIIILGFSAWLNFFILQPCRSQWPRGLRHELSSPAPTLRSWDRIPLRHGCLCVRFFCFYIVSSETASRPNKRLIRTYHWISLLMSYIKSAN
jgi:hypothetical protein